jgi:hypothetical protein
MIHYDLMYLMYLSCLKKQMMLRYQIFLKIL